jgi:sugar phosphate isomerase/epimerase
VTAGNVRIGNQSAFSARPLTLPFDHAVAAGFDAFEWFPDRRADGAGWTEADLGPDLRRSLRARARDHGIALSVHAPLHAGPLRPGGPAALEGALRLATDLGAGLLNAHFDEPGRPEEFARALAPFLDRCAAVGVRLALENVPAAGPDAFNRLFSLLPRGAPVGMCLDVGHANLHPATHNDYLGYVDRLGEQVPIVHLHLHENWGDRDSHLVIFSGPAGRDPAGLVGLFRRLRGRGFVGSVVLEQWPDPPAQLDQARARLLDLLARLDRP